MVNDGKDINDTSLETALSAYLDGELTVGQTKRLEQQLLNDPAARQVLAELRGVRELIGQLPRQNAPAELIEGIHSEFERDILLGNRDLRTDIAGRNHLRLRRFIAAAAMILLTGGIAVIVYSALSGKNMPTVKPPAQTDSRLAESDRSVLDRPGSQTTELPTTATTEPPRSVAKVEPPSEPKRLRYSTVKLLASCDDLAGSIEVLEILLHDAEIDQVVRSSTADGRQYAFCCSSGELAALFAKLKAAGSDRIDLLLSETGELDIKLTDLTDSQLLAMADLPDRQDRLSLASQYPNYFAEPVVTPPAYQTEEFAAGLPYWLGELHEGREHPELTELRVLGRVAVEAPCATCPPKELLPYAAVTTAPQAAKKINTGQPEDYERSSVDIIAVILILQTPLQPKILGNTPSDEDATEAVVPPDTTAWPN